MYTIVQMENTIMQYIISYQILSEFLQLLCTHILYPGAKSTSPFRVLPFYFLYVYISGHSCPENNSKLIVNINKMASIKNTLLKNKIISDCIEKTLIDFTASHLLNVII